MAKSYDYFPTNFRAQCMRVIDGDTVELLVDCGFHNFKRDRFRLLGIDTPETHSKNAEERKKAQEATEYVKSALHPMGIVVDGDYPLRVLTFKDPDSFGRWLVELYYKDDNGEERHLNKELLDLGHAVPFKK
jgi:endonuclease YncB( thermonuclease family)